MNTKKVLLIGGPGTGKSTLINALKALNYTCFDEISREVTLNAQQQGIDQLFIENPILFSELLLKGRITQFKEADKTGRPFVFFDRGIPDTVAYLNYVNISFPEHFTSACKTYVYDMIFILNPWMDIYTSDNERYENFSQAQDIHKHITNTYLNLNYTLIEVPFDTIEQRVNFILNHLKS